MCCARWKPATARMWLKFKTAWRKMASNFMPMELGRIDRREPRDCLKNRHFGLERFKKNCSHPVELGMKPGLLTFDFVSAQSQGFQTCSFAKASPKVKTPGYE